jgi:hypothetical protein
MSMAQAKENARRDEVDQGAGAGPYWASAPEPRAPRVRPAIGDPVVTALASQLGEGGALSTMNAAAVLEAGPRPIPWSPRPAMSGATLWTSVSTSVPAAVTASAGERHWPAAEVVRRAGEDDECGHDRDEVGDGGQRQVGMAQPVGSAVQLVQRDRAC